MARPFAGSARSRPRDLRVAPVAFKCNICGTRNVAGAEQIGRDTSSCSRCNSTPRTRAVIHALSAALFGYAVDLPDFPSRLDLAGIGLSDWGYDEALASKFAYRNTFYDEDPRLDITDPPQELEGRVDFLISSDVFEHVPPPVERAFEGAFRLLKPGGLLVLTVPYFEDKDETKEHFPSLGEFEVVDFKGSKILINHAPDGSWEVFDRLRFHGGPGLTIEMRIFSHRAVLEHLRRAGFEDIVDWRQKVPDFGGCWPENEAHSFPFVARRPVR